MKTRRAALLMCAAISCLACVVSVNEGSNSTPSTTNTDPVEPAEPTPAIVEAPGPTPAPAADAALPECPAERGADTYCTESGKLAGRWQMVDHLRVPDDAQVLFEAAHPDAQGQPSLRVSVVGTTLYIEHVTCGACRRVMGQGFEGDPAQLNDEQRRAVQTKLGLASDVALLDSVEAWRDYAHSEAGKATLTTISTRTDR